MFNNTCKYVLQLALWDYRNIHGDLYRIYLFCIVSNTFHYNLRRYIPYVFCFYNEHAYGSNSNVINLAFPAFTTYNSIFD